MLSTFWHLAQPAGSISFKGMYLKDETVSGCAAGVVGTLLGFPLDNIKTRMQTQSSSKGYGTVASSAGTIYRHEGFMGFYRGIAAPLSALTVLNTLNFSSYAFFRSKVGLDYWDVAEKSVSGDNNDKNSGNRMGWVEPRFFVAGAMAGPLAAFISTPFELLKTQVTTNKDYGSTLNATRVILGSHGTSALFRAHSVNTSREMLFLGTYFFVYEHAKDALTKVLPLTYGVPMAGGLSGAIGWFVSFPLDSVKGIIQAAPLHQPPRRAIEVARKVLDNKGLWGLYRGLAPSITRAFVVSSVRFSAYEVVMSVLRRRSAGLE